MFFFQENLSSFFAAVDFRSCLSCLHNFYDLSCLFTEKKLSPLSVQFKYMILHIFTFEFHVKLRTHNVAIS